MTRKPLPSPRGGVAGLALLFCATAGGAGLAFDLLGDAPAGFWLLADPGGRAMLGAGAVTILVLIAHGARWLLARRAGEKGGRDVGDHP
ncbi:MAG TPA: hypothetical protein PLK37_08485 [Terricaulis sp.]|nr:hypothetical protein [Terricaulis sp.]